VNRCLGGGKGGVEELRLLWNSYVFAEQGSSAIMPLQWRAKKKKKTRDEI